MRLPKPKYLLLSLLVCSRWVIYGFSDIALIAILRKEGASLAQISLLIAVGFLFLFKFLWAPIVDRVKIGKSQYKPWFIASQFLIAVGLLPLLAINPAKDVLLLFVLLAIASLAATFRDIAMDGLSVKILSESERAEGNGYMSAGFMLGMVIGGGLILIAYDSIGWHATVGVLILATLLPIPVMWQYKEPELGPEMNQKAGSMFSGLADFFRVPGNRTWALLIMLIASAGTMGNGLLSVVLVDLKWSLAKLGWIMNVIAPLLAAIASVGAGIVFAKCSRKTALITTLVLVALTGFALVPAVAGSLSETSVAVLVVISIVTAVLSNIAAKTAITDKSAGSPKNAASFFTIQASLAQVSSIFLGSLAPLLADEFGYVPVFVASAVIALLATLGVARYKHL
jgi:MFS transporter, PAT family, beta-lactamase induction signal transducer AmpG